MLLLEILRKLKQPQDPLLLLEATRAGTLRGGNGDKRAAGRESGYDFRLTQSRLLNSPSKTVSRFPGWIPSHLLCLITPLAPLFNSPYRRFYFLSEKSCPPGRHESPDVCESFSLLYPRWCRNVTTEIYVKWKMLIVPLQQVQTLTDLWGDGWTWWGGGRGRAAEEEAQVEVMLVAAQDSQELQTHADQCRHWNTFSRHLEEKARKNVP